jgi:hypothetical protein
MTEPFDPEVRANAALTRVLESQWQGEPALVLRSPPGAGKTGVAQRVALQSASMLDQRCMVVTQTNEQAFDSRVALPRTRARSRSISLPNGT